MIQAGLRPISVMSAKTIWLAAGPSASRSRPRAGPGTATKPASPPPRPSVRNGTAAARYSSPVR